jgi:hypothetical protein
VLLRRLDGCNREQFEAPGYRGMSRRKVLVVRTDDALTDERPNRILHHPDGCKGTKLTVLNFAQSLLKAHN